MQTLDYTQLKKDFDNTISRCLNKSYNPNTGKNLFASTESIRPDQNQIDIDFNDIQIGITSPDIVLVISKFEYRIPQTRIYITELQNEDFLIKIFQYFDKAIMFAEYYNLKSNQSIEISNSAKQLTILYPESERIKKTSYKLPVETGFIAQIAKEDVPDIIDPVSYIKKCINKERDSHPLSKVQSHNLDYLSDLDSAWAMINYVYQDNQINIVELIKTGIYNFVWLQEIYIYFGWFDQLKLFYKEINHINLADTESSLIQSCSFRYNYICKLLGQQEIKLSHVQSKQNIKIEGKYLDYFLRYFDLVNINIYEEIQNTWNYLHLPAIQLKLKNQIYENPDEFIALAYLALHNYFWWYPKLEDIILQNLPSNKQAIFRFLSFINKSHNMHFEKESLYFSKIETTSNVEGHKNIVSQYLHKNTNHGRKQFTYLEKDNSFSLKINKNINLQYLCKSNTIDIKPHLYYMNEETQSKFKIQISENILNVPLIWDQFVIEFNKCRFKFLRKKDRFQVTVKFAKTIKQIILNNEIIENKNGAIQRYYITIKRNKSIAYLSFFNEFGARIQEINPKMTRVFLKGYGYNVFGILNTKFRVYLSNQKKSYEVNLNEIEDQSLFLGYDNNELTLRAVKSDPITIKLTYIDPFILKLAYTDPAELFYRLKIYTEDQNKNLDEIRVVCQSNLGFIAHTDNLSELVPDKNNIIVIICKSYKSEKLNNDEEFRIINIDDKSKQTALWLSPNNIKNLFSETFFGRSFH